MNTKPDVADQALARAIAAGPFSSRHGETLRVDQRAFNWLVLYAYAESMTGLVADAVRAERVQMSDELIHYFADEHRTVMARNLQAEAATIRVIRVLEDAGVRHRLLKGIALAHGVYSDPSHRSFGDVDILLHPDDFQRGLDAIIARGGSRRIAELRRGFDARFGKDIAVSVRGAEIDVHRTLIEGPYGQRIPTEHLASRSRRIEIGGASTTTLDLSDLYVHAAVTAGAGDVPPRLVTLRDLLEIEAHAEFDPGQVITRANEWGVAPAVARAVQLVDRLLLPDARSELFEWASNLQPSRREQLLLSSYTGRGRRRALAAGMLLVLPTWRDRVAFSVAVVYPTRAHLSSRSFGRTAHFRRALSQSVGDSS